MPSTTRSSSSRSRRQCVRSGQPAPPRADPRRRARRTDRVRVPHPPSHLRVDAHRVRPEAPCACSAGWATTRPRSPSGRYGRLIDGDLGAALAPSARDCRGPSHDRGRTTRAASGPPVRRDARFARRMRALPASNFGRSQVVPSAHAVGAAAGSCSRRRSRCRVPGMRADEGRPRGVGTCSPPTRSVWRDSTPRLGAPVGVDSPTR